MMSDEHSRRQFLRLLGSSSGALLVGGAACSNRRTSTDNASSEDLETADAGSDAGQTSCQTTGSDIEGPFFEEGAPERTTLADDDEPGERLVIEGTVYGPDCTTSVDGALLDVWQADVDGEYHGGDDDNYRLRGQIMTDANGAYRFETIKPGNYPMAGGTMRPAHIHFTITKPGYTPLTTQLYFEDDPHLAPDDPCGHCGSDDPTLIIDLHDADEDGVDYRGTFDIVLASG